MSSDINSVSPLISVIVPVYNVDKYLSKCIESILEQTYSNLQLILVDDGSTDQSYTICMEYERKDTRIIVLQQKNAGSSVARNSGLKIAKGEFIGFVDSDDWILPTMFEDLIKFAIAENLPAVECGLITSKNIKGYSPPDSVSTIVENQEQALARIIIADSFAVWRRIYRSSILKGMSFIPGKIHQDVFFTLDVIDKIKNIGLTTAKYYIYNTENESVIRSPYSLKKLDAKDAVYYVQKIGSKYNSEIKQIGNRYLIRGLIKHYIPLFSHEHLDRDLKHRKKLKGEIRENYHLLNRQWNFEKIEALIIILSPFWFYNMLLQINQKRINIKLRLMHTGHV